MKCPICKTGDMHRTIWFNYCFTCEDWMVEVKRRIAARIQRFYNTFKE